MSEANHERALLQRLAAGPVGGDVVERVGCGVGVGQAVVDDHGAGDRHVTADRGVA